MHVEKPGPETRIRRMREIMEETKRGRIEISPTAIATLASEAVLESYGVVGMASRNLIDGRRKK